MEEAESTRQEREIRSPTEERVGRVTSRFSSCGFPIRMHQFQSVQMSFLAGFFLTKRTRFCSAKAAAGRRRRISEVDRGFMVGQVVINFFVGPSQTDDLIERGAACHEALKKYVCISIPPMPLWR